MDQELLELFDIPASLLPEVKDSSEILATTRGKFVCTHIPINGMAGINKPPLFGSKTV